MTTLSLVVSFVFGVLFYRQSSVSFSILFLYFLVLSLSCCNISVLVCLCIISGSCDPSFADIAFVTGGEKMARGPLQFPFGHHGPLLRDSDISSHVPRQNPLPHPPSPSSLTVHACRRRSLPPLLPLPAARFSLSGLPFCIGEQIVCPLHGELTASLCRHSYMAIAN